MWIITIAILIVEVALFQKFSLYIITVLCLPGNPVLLACKGRAPKLEQSRKGHKAGKRLVPGKFERLPKLSKTEEESCLPTVDIPQVAFTVGIALVGAVYVGIMMGINGNKS